MRIRVQRRAGALVVESAVVYSLLMLLLIGLIVAGLGVFRYHEVAWLAREGARYASVRGEIFQRTTGTPAATPEEVYNKVILPKVVALDVKNLTYSVTWNPDNKQGSEVTVTVTYKWLPELFFGGRDLTSTSTVKMNF
ncbi:MAG: hypothetical protein L0215_03035 [Gemmataceae bacterium]|nr:hypothetical protein [Gemmataceae bacterium]